MKIISVAIQVAFLSASIALAAKPTLNYSANPSTLLPACEKSPTFLTANKNILRGGMKAIPKGMLVAREANFYVESRTFEGTLVKIQSHQSFINSKSNTKPKVVCGSSEAPLKNRFSMMAPTLINNDAEAQSKNIFWQFQVLAENTKLSSWNTKSLALSSSQDLERTLGSLGYEAKVFQLSSSQFEIVYSQKLADKNQALSIIYDLD
jgi:hypothetical protein